MLGTLLRFRLRRDRLRLGLWVAVLFLLSLLIVSEVRDTFGTLASRVATLRILLVTPAVLLFRGTPQGTSSGDFVAVLGLAFVALLVGLMSTFLVVRHTRAEEEDGQADAVAATAAGRRLPTLAVLLHVALADLLVTVAIAAGLLAGGLPVGGSVLLAAGCGMCGLVFAGVALLLAQVLPTARAANGASAAVVVAAYFVRGIGDAAGTPHPETFTLTPAWPSALSPIGWAQAIHPFADDDPAPLLLGLVASVVLAAAALALAERRDVGAGLVAARRAREHASAWLGGPFGLAVRLERLSLAGWIVGLVAFAALMGGLSVAVVHQLDQAGPGIATVINRLGGSNGTIQQAFANLGAQFGGVLAAAICVQAAQRLRQEEAAGRADAVLATATGRVRWLLSHLLLAALAAAVGLELAGLVAGWLSDGGEVDSGTWLLAFLWQLPAALVFLGIVALVFAVVPQATVPAGWLVFAAAVYLGIFGPLSGVPDWARHLAPFADVPAPALPTTSYTGGAVLALAAVVLVVAAVVLFGRRDTRPVG
ncbi:polyketide antibiotic transporter [Amnibacterium sp. CER49]|uniref:ABC transporter permease n=1 Tax=Amnibacterium sp. CER49 TaxID=3039161 RepID=UPI002449A4D2|nr:polyketide antibiotic transporter [Amnibacterium sp. CER49]MDH2442630.1 polyketide antibiotic transporter [Amnibacterium sp. CER49]